MDYLNFIISNQKEESISIQRANCVHSRKFRNERPMEKVKPYLKQRGPDLNNLNISYCYFYCIEHPMVDTGYEYVIKNT